MSEIVLNPIKEDSEAIEASASDGASVKAELEAAKLKTAELKEAVSKDLLELSSLLEKLNEIDNATREEKDCGQALHSKLDNPKKEIKGRKKRESEAEMKLLQLHK